MKMKIPAIIGIAILSIVGTAVIVLVTNFYEDAQHERELALAEAQAAKPNTAIAQTLTLRSEWSLLADQLPICLMTANPAGSKACFVNYAKTVNTLSRRICGAVIFEDPDSVTSGMDLFKEGTRKDSDSDGLNNHDEWQRGLHPCLVDSFGDGVKDGQRGADGLKVNLLKPSTFGPR